MAARRPAVTFFAAAVASASKALLMSANDP